MNNNSKNSNKLIVLLSVFFVVTIVMPLIFMLFQIEVTTFKELIESFQFRESLVHSLISTTIATVISVSLAFLLAYGINRSNMKYKKIFTLLFTLPMLIPSISHGLGLINLFGENGIITKTFGININIFGINGIILGSIMYSFPAAFLIISDGFKYIDQSLYEMCQVFGISKIRTFFKVTMYYMLKPTVSAIFATFTMIFTDYGVALAVGGRYSVLPVLLYKEVIGRLDFSKGAILGCILVLPAIISFIYDLLSKDNSNLGTVCKEASLIVNKKRDIFFTIISTIVVIFIFMIIGSFILMSFVNKYPYDLTITLNHYIDIFKNGFILNIINSIVLAVLTATIGTIIAYFTAYVVTRIGGKRTKFLHMVSMASIAIPGIVLGLSFTLVFNQTFLYGTLFIMVMVNIVHFFASPYLMCFNALNKLNKNYEVIGKTFGIRRLRIIFDVIIPSTKETIIEMFSYFFVNSMITISAIAFLYTTNTMPMSLLINQYEGQGIYEKAASISILILMINIIFKMWTEIKLNKKKEVEKW